MQKLSDGRVDKYTLLAVIDQRFVCKHAATFDAPRRVSTLPIIQFVKTMLLDDVGRVNKVLKYAPTSLITLYDDIGDKKYCNYFIVMTRPLPWF